MATELVTPFHRSGVSDAFLARAGCAHVGADECARLYGFRAEGIAIPFCGLNGFPIKDGGWPFVRVRLYHETDEQKYSQRRDSSSHVYIPPRFGDRPKGSTLILVEGEFKSLALAEAGFSALGLCGLNGAARTLPSADGEREHALHDELASLLELHRPARLVFLGDADVVFNAQFATEAAKLRKLIRGARRFPFVETVLAAKLPVDGPKGIDDCRQHYGDGFNARFEKLLADAYDIPSKATAVEVFAEFLWREAEAVAKFLAADSHYARCARVKLLHSAAQLWNETGAKLELKPLLADALAVKPSEVPVLIKDATSKRQGRQSTDAKSKSDAQGSAVEFANVEPWEKPVNGAEVLNELAATFSRYIALPPGAADALALWTAHTHAFDAFIHTPRLNPCSPDKGCGKTTLLDVLAALVPRPLRTESITPAVLFRLVELHKPTLLLDEVDAYLNEAEELRGLLNAGHKRGAKAYRCEGENNAVRSFAAFAPAALAGIGSLPGTLHDRSIVIKLVRSKPGEVTARFDSRRTEKETELCRKLARWITDNLAKLKECDPQLPQTAFNRLADNWRPLFAVAEVAGGDWPQRAAAAFAKLTSEDDLDAQGVGTILLADIASLFAAAGVDKLPSAALAKSLAEMEGRPWADWGKFKKPISPNQLANQLRRFGVAPRTIRVGDETAKGYALPDFTEAFDRFLPKPTLSDRHTVTTLENIGASHVSKTSQPETVLRSENTTGANNDSGCDVVTVQSSELDEVLL